MLAALLLASGCWRPDAYEPPAAPPPEDEADVAAPTEPDAEAPREPDGAAEEPGGEEDEAPPGEAADEGEEPEPAPFPAYTAHTIQGPVTIVDDYGRPLAVLAAPGFPVEVRSEEEGRVRVDCAACKPPVEGWIQSHLVAR